MDAAAGDHAIGVLRAKKCARSDGENHRTRRGVRESHGGLLTRAARDGLKAVPYGITVVRRRSNETSVLSVDYFLMLSL